MSEKLLITKLVRTNNGHAYLYCKGRQFSDLTLFDLSDLADVNIDIKTLEIGIETPCRFWAHYTVSAKLKKTGNPYKDIIGLELAGNSTPATNGNGSDVVAELRAIKALLQRLVELAEDRPLVTGTPQAGQDPPPSAGPPVTIHAPLVTEASASMPPVVTTANGIEDIFDDVVAEISKSPATDELDLTGLPEGNEARAAFYALAADAIKDSQVAPETINELTAVANGDGWTVALATLKEKIR